MGLKFYRDAECTDEITDASPDYTRKPVIAGSDWIDERSLWIKSDDPALTYENIVIAGRMYQCHWCSMPRTITALLTPMQIR